MLVRGGSLGVIYLRYHGGIGSLINWSFGTFFPRRVGVWWEILFRLGWYAGGVCLESVVYLSRVVDRLSLRSLSALVSLGASVLT